jgi:hypothetical protein
LLLAFALLSSRQNSFKHVAAVLCLSQITAYEVLMRRLIRRVPNAALLAVSAFNFMTFDSSLSPLMGHFTAENFALPNPYYGSGMTLRC